MKTHEHEVFLKGEVKLTLRERRIAAGMTQEQLAKKLDVDQAAVSHWENGKSRPVSKSLKKLARLYKCTVAELMEETDG